MQHRTDFARHPDYERMIGDWQKVRDTCEGERAVKDRGALYLPVPDGFERDGGAASRRYARYMQRASLPDLVGPTVLGMVGIMNAKPIDAALPPSLEPVREIATNDGLTLDGLKARLDAEIILCGRVVLVADIAQDGTPYLTVYSAECLINWASQTGADGRARLSLAVLREMVPADGADPLFDTVPVEQYRVYRLTDTGAVTVETWRKRDGRLVLHDAPKILTVAGGQDALGTLPVWVIGSQDVTPDVDMVPLLGLAGLAVRIYQQDADYRAAIHATSFPTLVIRGELEGTGEGGEGTIELGAGAALVFADAAGDAKFLEFAGPGVAAQRQSIQDDFVQAITIAVQSLQGRGVESGEALGLRMKAKTASLSSITTAVAQGLERGLRLLAFWQRAPEDSVTITANLDFQDGPLDPSIVSATVQAWSEGAVPVELVYEAFRRVRLTSATNEELESGAFRKPPEPDPEPEDA